VGRRRGRPSSQALELTGIVLDWYRPLFDANVAVDFARATDDLDGYRLVVAPNLYLLSDEGLSALTATSRPAASCARYFSGVVDEHDHVRVEARWSRSAG
jgi:beta-galactosidase